MTITHTPVPCVCHINPKSALHAHISAIAPVEKVATDPPGVTSNDPDIPNVLTAHAPSFIPQSGFSSMHPERAVSPRQPAMATQALPDSLSTDILTAPPRPPRPVFYRGNTLAWSHTPSISRAALLDPRHAPLLTADISKHVGRVQENSGGKNHSTTRIRMNE